MNNRAIMTDNIGIGVDIGPFTYIGKNVSIGENTKIGKSVVIGNNSKMPIYIKDYVTIGDLCVIESPIKSYTLLERGVVMSFSSGISYDTILHEGAFLGSGTKVAGNLSEVGKFSILGFNSIVSEGRVFEPYSLLTANSVYNSPDSASGIVWLGNPAIPIKVFEDGLLKIENKVERDYIKLEAETFLAWWRGRN